MVCVCGVAWRLGSACSGLWVYGGLELSCGQRQCGDGGKMGCIDSRGVVQSWDSESCLENPNVLLLSELSLESNSAHSSYSSLVTTLKPLPSVPK